MCYCEYYFNCSHHSLSHSRKAANSVSLQIPQLPLPLKWQSKNYPCFLSGTVQFFVFTLLFFISPLISSHWHGHWWGFFQLCCCCLFSTIVYSLSLNVSDQGRAGTVPVRTRGTAQYVLHEGGGLTAVYAGEWLTFLRHSPWLWLVVLSREWWILASEIRATGWTHRQWIFTQLTYILFTCQINDNWWQNCYRIQL